MFTNLSDIYNANIGDKIVLNKDETVIADVYAESLSLGKWISILDHLVNDTYVIEILDPNDITNKVVITHIVGSDFFGLEEDGKMAILIPDHINRLSLKTALYLKCKGCALNTFEQHIIITKKVNSFNTELLLTDFNTGDIKTVNKRDCANVKSTTSALYRMATKAGISIKIKVGPRSLVITHMGLIDTTVPHTSFTAQLNEWLESMPYDLTVNIPARFIDVKSLAYINTVVNKSKFNCKCRAGVITKMSACLKKSGGTILVCVKESVVKVVNKPSFTNIDSRDRRLINLSLKPHGLSYEDVR